MKPFNLEAALRGEPVVTRRGSTVWLNMYSNGRGMTVGVLQREPNAPIECHS